MRTGQGAATVARGDQGSATLDAGAFRGALRHHAGGVAIITAAAPDGPAGITVTSLTAASLHPPLVSFYVSRDSRSWPALAAADRFAVHLLDGSHRDLATRFARRGIDRFAPPTRWHPGPGGVPLLDDAAVRLVCARRDIVPVGDHYLVVGEVLDVSGDGGNGDPLLYAHGQFGRWSPAGPAAAGEPGEGLDLADTVEP